MYPADARTCGCADTHTSELALSHETNLVRFLEPILTGLQRTTERYQLSQSLTRVITSFRTNVTGWARRHKLIRGNEARKTRQKKEEKKKKAIKGPIPCAPFYFPFLIVLSHIFPSAPLPDALKGTNNAFARSERNLRRKHGETHKRFSCFSLCLRETTRSVCSTGTSCLYSSDISKERRLSDSVDGTVRRRCNRLICGCSWSCSFGIASCLLWRFHVYNSAENLTAILILVNPAPQRFGR